MSERQHCPKCGDWRLARVNVGSEFEEKHCLSCGLVISIGLLTRRRTVTPEETGTDGEMA